jgi:hypothetical protein
MFFRQNTWFPYLGNLERKKKKKVEDDNKACEVRDRRHPFIEMPGKTHEPEDADVQRMAPLIHVFLWP